jgi:hypothetical protein
MSEKQHQFTTTLLWVTALYYCACGLSAIFIPSLWLLAAGLSTEMTPEAQSVLWLVFGVAGVYLLTMAFGATLGAISPSTRRPLLLTLAVGNLIDFVITLKAVVAGSLNMISGGLFLAVAAAFGVLLFISYVKARLAAE